MIHTVSFLSGLQHTNLDNNLSFFYMMNPATVTVTRLNAPASSRLDEFTFSFMETGPRQQYVASYRTVKDTPMCRQASA